MSKLFNAKAQRGKDAKARFCVFAPLRLCVLFFLFVVLVSCNPSSVAPASPTAGRNTPPSQTTVNLKLSAGYTATVVAEGLQGPTQMILGPDQRLWVAQLVGNEEAGQGQVVALDLQTGQRQVLLDKLLKPVGLAVLKNYVWIAAKNALLRAPLDANGKIGKIETVLANLPFNGRSIGTLTVTPDQQLLYETSGARAGNRAVPGSATLWVLDPANPKNPRQLATGLKGAYAQTYDQAGRLWTTEIADDPVNGVAPPDELNWVVAGADFGWPQCYGKREVAHDLGGTDAFCQKTRAAVAIFPPHATPTSIVASPWEKDTLFVALWAQGIVMRVPVTIQGDNATGTPEPFITGFQNVQHLLVLPDGALLVSDFSAGKIYRIIH
ncbi:MAG: PQQ-dependent sugar dehydrogenase [Caldilineaceae bacterium]